MKLDHKGLKDKASWENAGIKLPLYDVEEAARAGKTEPEWIHFGAGNIFRAFIGKIADNLLSEGLTNKGMICAETYDRETVEKAYAPYDNLFIDITLKANGERERRVRGSVAESIVCVDSESGGRKRLEEIFRSPSLRLVSFTITEKGYYLTDANGGYLASAKKDIEAGPGKATGMIPLLTALLFERFRADAPPLALVSMDNVSQNGRILRDSVLTIAGEWTKRDLVPAEFVKALENEKIFSFPWTMIDKITPRPNEDEAEGLTALGVEGMEIFVTDKKTYVAPFVNAEEPGYLVIEDSFPNGRPPLEKAGVYMTDRETVNKAERMKVTACLNPIHTGICTFGRLLGYELFADAVTDPDLSALAHIIGYKEGHPVVDDPKILSPEAFLKEVLEVRFPNRYLGDTNARIAVDISQMLAIRFGETVSEHVKRHGSAKGLIGIPLAIAGWLRYLDGTDDEGRPFEISPDPMLPQLKACLDGSAEDDGDALHKRLLPLLSNESIFGSDRYDAGIGSTIEKIYQEMLRGNGAVRNTLKKRLPRTEEDQCRR